MGNAGTLVRKVIQTRLSEITMAVAYINSEKYDRSKQCGPYDGLSLTLIPPFFTPLLTAPYDQNYRMGGILAILIVSN